MSLLFLDSEGIEIQLHLSDAWTILFRVETSVKVAINKTLIHGHSNQRMIHLLLRLIRVIFFCDEVFAFSTIRMLNILEVVEFFNGFD